MEEHNYDTDATWKEVLLTDEGKVYIGVYVALMVLAASKFILFEAGIGYWGLFTGLMVMAAAKTALIVAYFQHLRWEPKILTYLYAMSLFAVLLLMAAASYSIT